MSRVIIVHGWGGSSQKDWMPWVKRELEQRGFEVTVPLMPETEYPKIETWVPYLSQVIGEPKENDILIGHSIGCQTILRFLESLNSGQKVEKVIMVAGFGPYLTGLNGDEKLIVKPWVETPINFGRVLDKADEFAAIFSDNDPFVLLRENIKLFEDKLKARIIIEKHRGHFNDDTLPVLLELI